MPKAAAWDTPARGCGLFLRPSLWLCLAAVPASLAGDDVASARVDAAKSAYEAYQAQYSAGAAQVESVYVWSMRLYQSEVAAGRDEAARSGHRARMTALQAFVRERVAAGMAAATDGHAVNYYVAEAAALSNQ